MINNNVESLYMVLSLWLQSVGWFTDDVLEGKCVIEVEKILKLIDEETNNNEEL